VDIQEDVKEIMMKKWPLALEKLKALSEGSAKTMITIESEVKASVEKTWNCWTMPEHIMKWNHASDDWYCPAAANDLQPGGKFSATMAARDGSFRFDFSGVYTEVIPHKKISYTMDDDRKATILFEEKNGITMIRESFEAESTNTLELQRFGWQAILDNFKKHTESV